MIATPLITALLFALPNAAQHPAPQSEEPAAKTWPVQIGQPAPPLGISPKPSESGNKKPKFDEIVEQHRGELPADFEADQAKIISNLANGSSKGRVSLADLHGKVVVVHLMSPESQDATFHTLPLLRDLKTANEDRGFDLVCLLPKQDDLQAFQQTYEVSWAVAEFQQDSASPYLLSKSRSGNWVWVISRSGFVYWQGNPKNSEKEFLKTTATLLDQGAAPSLGRPLHSALDKAVASYRTGKWDAARKASNKLVKKHEGKPDPEDQIIFDDAKLLSRLVDEHEVQLSNQTLKALDKRKPLTYYLLRNSFDEGFPRSKVRKQLEQQFKENKKNLIRASSLADGTRVYEILSDRPVLFPARKSSVGDRIAEELAKALKKTNNDIEPTQRARELLRKYAKAVRVKSR